LHLLLRNPGSDSGGGPDRRGNHMAGTLVPSASYELTWSVFHRAHPDYFRMERGVLEHQSYQCESGALDRIYRLLLESRRSVRGEIIRCVASCGGSDYGAWMAYPEAACAGLDLWRSEVGSGFGLHLSQ